MSSPGSKLRLRARKHSGCPPDPNVKHTSAALAFGFPRNSGACPEMPLPARHASVPEPPLAPEANMLCTGREWSFFFRSPQLNSDPEGGLGNFRPRPRWGKQRQSFACVLLDSSDSSRSSNFTVLVQGSSGEAIDAESALGGKSLSRSETSALSVFALQVRRKPCRAGGHSTMTGGCRGESLPRVC